jgi:uncharacterized protein (TIGR02452 family)
MLLPRDRAAELGQETVRILEAGSYRSPAGKVVDLRDLLRRAVAGTRSYPPDQGVPAPQPGNRSTQFEVTNETTLSAARRLADEGQRFAALNFASAKHPGGGFLTGSRAQEESLARSSGLYACLAGKAMYTFHTSRADPLYTAYAIYSPDVPVFRTDDGQLLEEPWLCSFLTCAAVNARAVLQRNPSRRPEIRQAMAERIDRVLALLALHDHPTLLLGAWGCGAFGNDTEEIANLFRAALTGPYAGVFDRVVFAITDWSAERRFIGPFQRAFGR